MIFRIYFESIKEMLCKVELTSHYICFLLTRSWLSKIHLQDFEFNFVPSCLVAPFSALHINFNCIMVVLAEEGDTRLS